MKARRVPNAVGVSLARNRRSPKRPSEPRPSGVHPEEDAVEKDGVAFRWRIRMVVRYSESAHRRHPREFAMQCAWNSRLTDSQSAIRVGVPVKRSRLLDAAASADVQEGIRQGLDDLARRPHSSSERGIRRDSAQISHTSLSLSRAVSDLLSYSSLFATAIAFAMSDAMKFWKLSSAAGSRYRPRGPSSAFDIRKQAASYNRSRTSLVSRIS